MILTLEVTGAQAQDMGACHRKVFNGIGGTIGRLPDNDWVFTDRYVSGRHALIRYLSGKFFVEDTSTNGVFINSIDNRLARGQPQELRHGDLLYIDAYKINVAIHSDATVALVASRPQPALNRTMLHIEDEDEEEDDDHDTEWYGGGDISDSKPNATAALLPQRPQAQVARPVVPKPVAPKSSNEAQLQA